MRLRYVSWIPFDSCYFCHMYIMMLIIVLDLSCFQAYASIYVIHGNMETSAIPFEGRGQDCIHPPKNIAFERDILVLFG